MLKNGEAGPRTYAQVQRRVQSPVWTLNHSESIYRFILKWICLKFRYILSSCGCGAAIRCLICCSSKQCRTFRQTVKRCCCVVE